MKRIKITDAKMNDISANDDAIVAALAAVNGRSSSFCITTFWAVAEAAKDAEKALSAIPKADRVGTIVSHRMAGPSSAYKYKANATGIRLERTSSGWYLADVMMSTVYPKEPALFKITITDATRDAIAKAALAPFTLHPATPI
jgi:hypothetical protein